METSHSIRTFAVLRHPVTTLRVVANTAPTTRAGLLFFLSQAALILSVGLPPILIFRLLREIAERCGLFLPGSIYDDLFIAFVALVLFTAVTGPLVALVATAIGAKVVNVLVHRLVKPSKGDSSGLFAGTGFAQVPLLLLIPVSTLGAIVAVAIGGEAGLLAVIIVPLLGLATFFLWSVMLAFIALRENYGLTTLRTLATIPIPIGVAGAVIAVLALAFGSLEVEASFDFNMNTSGCTEPSARPSGNISIPTATPTPTSTPGNPAIARVTRMAGSSYQPAWHPTGDSLAFISDAGGDWDIYSINVDGSGLVKMTNDPGSDQNPAWSPDGTKIAFISTRSGTPDIYKIFVMNADGAGITRLTNEPRGAINPVWSPDGARIAFSSMKGGDFEIYIMNVDGSGVVNLSQSPNSRDRYPSWSPDGTRIAFISVGSDLGTFLRVSYADGSAAVNLVEVTDGSKISWSPGGDALTFARHPDLFLINADGSGLTQLTNDQEPDRSPAWSPDGSRIAFSSGLGSDSDIYIIDLQSAVTIRPTPTPTPEIRFTPTPTPEISFAPTATPPPTPTPEIGLTPTAMPAPLPPSAYSSGTLGIPPSWTANLDRGVLSKEADADIWFRGSPNTVGYLHPIFGARIAVVGTTSIGRDGCAGAAWSPPGGGPGSNTFEIDVSNLPEGTYVCVLTNEGRYSEFRITAEVGPSPGTLNISYTTWETATPVPQPTLTPTATVRVNPAGILFIPPTQQADFDRGVVSGEEDADIWFRAATDRLRFLAPVNGARAEYMGGNPPGRDGCANASFSADEVAIKVPSPGFYVCVLTNAGRYSELRVYTDGAAGSLRVSFTTWE